MASFLSRRARAAAIAVLSALGLVFASSASGASSRKSPYVQIVGEATVVTEPRETVHKNRRRFLEFEVTLQTARPAADQPAGADRSLSIDTKGRVKVVHDLSCGGAALHLAVGDRIEVAGEYVHVPRGGDLIHFTHPADGSCGRGGSHPAGFLKRVVSEPAVRKTPRPGTLVPDQPYTGPPPAAAKPYEAIIAAKESGSSNADLLRRVEREGIAYSLTTPEIQKLRAAGVSEDVIEAMLRSGRKAAPAPAAVPPSPTPR